MGPDHYLCRSCWWSLPKDARTALSRSDDRDLARLRLLELYRQIFQDVPLPKIEITP